MLSGDAGKKVSYVCQLVIYTMVYVVLLYVPMW